MGMNRNVVTVSPLQNAAAILLGDVVTEDVTEAGLDAEMISVSDTATEIPAKRKRGRPAKGGVAMTAAERSRKYRERHRPAGQDRRVDLWDVTVERAEKLAAKQGASVAGVIDWIVRENAVCVYGSDFERAKAAAESSGRNIEFVVNLALSYVSDESWARIAKRQSGTADVAA